MHLVKDIIANHIGMYFHIAAFDSGSISPTEEETKKGWVSIGNIMVSPPIDSKLEVPYDNYDEWYIFKVPTNLPNDIEVFVNYGGFSIVPVDEQIEESDPTWERDSLDWLRPIQQRFWGQVNELNPQTYVSIGDKDIIVIKDDRLLKRCVKTHNNPLQPDASKAGAAG